MRGNHRNGNGNGSAIAKWRRDIVAFITEVLFDPETGEPFKLYPEQITFLRHAFELTPDGRMRYTELCFSAGKKSGKTALKSRLCLLALESTKMSGRSGFSYLGAASRESGEPSSSE